VVRRERNLPLQPCAEGMEKEQNIGPGQGDQNIKKGREHGALQESLKKRGLGMIRCHIDRGSAGGAIPTPVGIILSPKK